MTNVTDKSLTTRLVNKILFINHRRTSMRLCQTEWSLIDEICKIENTSRNDLIEFIESHNHSCLGLTYYTRLFIMLYFYEKSPFGKIKIRRHGYSSESYVSSVLTKISVSSDK